MQDYHYSQNFFIGYSDVDRNNRLKISRLLDLLQNIATAHSKEVGYGTEKMMELQMGWFLLGWKIKVLEYPKADTYVEIRTWSKENKGLHANRDFEILSEDGKQLILATSIWVLFDLVKQKPVRMIKEMIDEYGIINRNALEDGISRIREEEINGEIAEIIVGKRDIDTNGHVNNAKYMDFMLEVLPDDFSLKEIEIHYKKQALYGQKITIIFDGSTCNMKNENGEILLIAKTLC